MRHKIAIIGTGRVGQASAHATAMRALGDVVLVDSVPGLAAAKALDLAHACALAGADVRVSGSTGYEDARGADVVVVACGVARAPGESRDDVLRRNLAIVRPVAERLSDVAPGAIVVMVSNPLDTMAWVARHVTDWPRQRLLGMAGVLDTARLRAFVAMELGCSARDVSACVLGGHGEEMVPVLPYTAVGGIPVQRLLPEATLDGILRRTRGAGTDLPASLGFSAYFSPGEAVADLVQAVVRDEKRVLPCSAYLQGEYGVVDLYLGVPAMIGAGGVERIFEVQLDDEEQLMLQRSIRLCSESVDAARRLLVVAGAPGVAAAAG
jgi:malate dehydrogenase